MSTISASTTSNTAFKVTSDTTGTLVLQTGAVPTTAISIDASQVVSIGSIAVTGVTTFSAGSAAAPSITTTGDTNTGIFFPAADTIGFTEGGVESMRIDSSGNVGIGVTDPSTYGKLVVTGGGFTQLSTLAVPATTGSTRSDFTRIQDAAGSRVLDSSVSSSGAWIQSRDKNDYSVNYNLLLQANGGNVGIGTASPDQKLVVDGGATSTYLKVVGQSVNSFFGQDSTGLAVYQQGNKPLYFATNNTERARITSAGDLGVGTSSPTTGSLSNTATLNAGLFATLRGTVASTSGVAVAIGTALSSTNVGYIVSCGVASADPVNYCAVAVVSADNGVLRVTALQTAVLMSISVSGTSIQATQSSGGAQTLFFNILRIS